MEKKYRFFKISNILQFIGLLLFTHSGIAQPMSGTYRIGSSGQANFQTFSEAVDSLVTHGISGPVNIEVDSGRYTEQITLPAIVGSSARNTITFKGMGDKTVISFTRNYSMNMPAIALSGCQHIIFDSLAVEANTMIYGDVFGFHLSKQATHITIQHCKIEVPPNKGTTIISSGNVNSGSSKNNNADSIYIVSNELIGGRNSIFLQNESTNYMTHVVIKGNRFTNFYFASANIWYSKHTEFDNNFIKSSPSANHPRGVLFQHSRGKLSCQSNDIQLYGRLFIYGIAFKNGNLFDQRTPALCANNFISQMKESNDPRYKARGIFFEHSVKNIKVYHNSVIIRPKSSPMSAAFDLNNKSGTDSVFIFNNHFVNKGTGYPVNMYISGKHIKSDYNNFVSSGSFVGLLNGTAVSSLTAWHSGSQLDSHSVSIDPQFNLNGDLHIDTTMFNLKGLGTYLEEVPLDIDGDSRNTGFPDIGADEFTMHKDLAISSIENINSVWCKNVDSVEVQIHNQGLTDYNNILCTLEISNGFQTYFYHATLHQLSPSMTKKLTFRGIKSMAKGGTYSLRVYAVNTQDPFMKNDTLVNTVSYIVDLPVVDLGNDTIMPPNGFIRLNAPAGYPSYVWSNGAATNSLLVTAAHLSSTNVFWVAVTDSNSCTVSDTIRIWSATGMDEQERMTYRIYPNPAGPVLTFDGMTANHAIEVVEIFDDAGRQMGTWNVRNSLQLEISTAAFQKGFYVIKLSGNNRSYLEKLIIE